MDRSFELHPDNSAASEILQHFFKYSMFELLNGDKERQRSGDRITAPHPGRGNGRIAATQPLRAKVDWGPQGFACTSQPISTRPDKGRSDRDGPVRRAPP